MVDQFLHWVGVDMPSMFIRYEDLYTWSRWDKVVFEQKVALLVKIDKLFSTIGIVAREMPSCWRVVRL